MTSVTFSVELLGIQQPLTICVLWLSLAIWTRLSFPLWEVDGAKTAGDAPCRYSSVAGKFRASFSMSFPFADVDVWGSPQHAET